MAAACARYFSKQRKKTLYLNLEKHGTADVFFNAQGQWTMSDLIFALKSSESNFIMKFESFLRKDQKSGVYYCSGAQFALHMNELTSDDIQRLISEVSQKSNFDYVIIDMDFSLEQSALGVYRKAHNIVWVSDGSDMANSKVVRAYQAVSECEKSEDVPFTARICLAYNKFSNKTGYAVNGADLRVIGGAQRFEHATTEQILSQLVSTGIFEDILFKIN